MQNTMNISAFSTKTVNEYGAKYNNRSPGDIDAAIHYVMCGNQKEKPLYNSATGFSETDSKTIADEIKDVQELYHKETGIRIRGEIVELRKDELEPGKEREQIKAVADSISAHFLYEGFQTAYGVFDGGTCYRIIYAINPVSYGDGS